MNKLELIGRPTADPEISYYDTYVDGNPVQTSVARLSVAVSRFGAKENDVQADFIPCVAFGKMAERLQKYVKKGQQIYVEGPLRNNNYEDKDGKKVYGFQMTIQYMELLGKKNEIAEGEGEPGSPEKKETENEKKESKPVKENASETGKNKKSS